MNPLNLKGWCVRRNLRKMSTFCRHIQLQPHITDQFKDMHIYAGAWIVLPWSGDSFWWQNQGSHQVRLPVTLSAFIRWTDESTSCHEMVSSTFGRRDILWHSTWDLPLSLPVWRKTSQIRRMKLLPCLYNVFRGPKKVPITVWSQIRHRLTGFVGDHVCQVEDHTSYGCLPPRLLSPWLRPTLWPSPWSLESCLYETVIFYMSLINSSLDVSVLLWRSFFCPRKTELLDDISLYYRL